MTKTAVVLGRGPDSELVMKRSNSLPADVVLYTTNLSGRTPAVDGQLLPCINVYDATDTIRMLRAADVSAVVAIGSLKITGAFPFVRTSALLSNARPLLFALIRDNTSDEIRRIVFDRIRNDFIFPHAKTVLDFLFTTSDVSINPDARALAESLKLCDGSQRDARLSINNSKIVVLRVPNEESSVLASRRLYPEKLKNFHEKDGITHVFFDSDRTVIIDLDVMVAYATANNITLQSFRESDR